MDLNVIANAGAAVIVAYLFLRYMTGRDKSQAETHKALTTAIAELSENSKKQTVASEMVAEAQLRTAREAEQRNGHLGELMLEAKTATFGQQKAILKAVKAIAVEVKKGAK